MRGKKVVGIFCLLSPFLVIYAFSVYLLGGFLIALVPLAIASGMMGLMTLSALGYIMLSKTDPEG